MSNSKEAERLTPDARREQILRIAADHFARFGYETVSVPTIAKEAGVTRALVYHYFAGKDALLEAVLRAEADELLEATAPDPMLSPHDNLLRALKAYLEHFAKSSGNLRDLYAPHAASPDIVRELGASHHTIQIDRVIDLLSLEEKPVLRLGIGAWLSFVGEAARLAMEDDSIGRSDVIDVCVETLRAVTNSMAIR